MTELVPEEIRQAVDALQQCYLRALDSKDMPGWLDCFDREGSYFVTGADNDQDHLPIGLMFDDSYERLQDRVTYVTQVWPGAFEDYQTRHFLQPLDLQADEDGLWKALGNVTVFATDSLGSGTWQPVEGVQFDRYSNNRQIIRVREALGQRRFYRVEIREP